MCTKAMIIICRLHSVCIYEKQGVLLFSIFPHFLPPTYCSNTVHMLSLVRLFFFIENMWLHRCVWPWVTERLVMGVVSGTGFLSRWHLQDWQDAILCWNSVSQPASLSVRQPLTPLNLAFCWAVTGLQATLHVAILINCTINPNAVGTYVDGFSSLWCRYKRPLSSLSFVPLSFSHHTASYLPLQHSVPSESLEADLGFVLVMKWPFFSVKLEKNNNLVTFRLHTHYKSFLLVAVKDLC